MQETQVLSLKQSHEHRVYALKLLTHQVLACVWAQSLSILTEVEQADFLHEEQKLLQSVIGPDFLESLQGETTFKAAQEKQQVVAVDLNSA